MRQLFIHKKKSFKNYAAFLKLTFKWMLQTFFNDAPPPIGPVTQLNSVAFLNFSSLLETADELITQTVAVINTLHRPSVVPWLRNTHKNKMKQETKF